MNIDQDIDYLRANLSLHIHNVLPARQCGEMIERYEAASAGGAPDAVVEELIQECEGRVFTSEVQTLLQRYFQSPFKSLWPIFDVVDSSASTHNLNTRWHLDGGAINTHKIFIYLNPVAEHGGNTVMVDLESTKKLSRAGMLPVALSERQEDLTEVFEQLGIGSSLLAYDLSAGDALLFDPLKLAHKCLPPKAGKRRYTISFTIVPNI